MEETNKKKEAELNDRDIIFSQAVKAGKRIYYVDVKENRRGDKFLAITESKKIVSGEGDKQDVRFEKHKIFIYQEDFEKFTKSLNDAMAFIAKGEKVKDTPKVEAKQKQEVVEQKIEESNNIEQEDCSTTIDLGEEIKIDLDF